MSWGVAAVSIIRDALEGGLIARLPAEIEIGAPEEALETGGDCGPGRRLRGFVSGGLGRGSLGDHDGTACPMADHGVEEEGLVGEGDGPVFGPGDGEGDPQEGVPGPWDEESLFVQTGQGERLEVVW